MRTAIITLTRQGLRTASAIAKGLDGQVDLFYTGQQGRAGEEVTAFFPGVKAAVGEVFDRYHSLIMVMAAGIAVRALAAHLKSKRTDPAVIVVDEQGRNVISLLGGHQAGANELAGEIAAHIGGQAVITTASDLQGKVAVDVLARRLGFKLDPWSHLLAVDACLVNGGKGLLIVPEKWQPVIASHLGSGGGGWDLLDWHAWHETVTPGNVEANGNQISRGGGRADRRVIHLPRGYDFAAIVDIYRYRAGREVVFLRPPVVIGGVGCRAGTPARAILKALARAMWEAGLAGGSLAGLATLEDKAGEPGLVQAAQLWRLPLYSVEKDRLKEIINNDRALARSAFVSRVMGVEGVCEPAALAAAGSKELILPKRVFGPVTVALAEAG